MPEIGRPRSGELPSDLAVVTALLAAAGVPASAIEIERFAAAYPAIRAMVGLLHGVDGLVDEVPALVFDPDPRFVDWPPLVEG